MTEGDARFTGDLSPADALHMVAVRSDLPHASIDGIDMSEALAVPGVFAAFTSNDLGDVPHIPIRVGPTARLQDRLQPVIAIDHVRYVGEPIAVVLADTASAAWDAASLVRIDMTRLPPLPREREQAGPADWHERRDDLLVEVETRFGHAADVFSAAELIIESEFCTSRRTGLPIETRQLIAHWVDGDLHLWGVTKFVDFTTRTLASFFAVPEASIVCHRVDVGGMFGVRGEIYPEDFLVPWAALMTDRPVRWHEGRGEHLTSINHAGEQRHRARIAFDPSGHLRGFEDRVVLDMGAYARPIGSRLAHIVVETLPGPYRWEAVDLRCSGIATTKTPVGTIRGPAAFETAFVRERMIDMAASRLGVEPLEMRRTNLIGPESMPYRIPFEGTGAVVTYDSGDYPASLDEFAKLVQWDGVREERDRRRAEGQAVGLGWAMTVIHSGLGKEEAVTLDLDTSGTFVLRTSATEVGQGLDRTLATILRHQLGVPLDAVAVDSGGSLATSVGNGTFSSRSTIFVGAAAVDAAKRISALAVERAAELWGASASDIRLGPRGAERGDEGLAWKELAPLSARGEFRMDEPTYGFAVHLAQVTVDPETGDVCPERLWVGYDCGRAIDRMGVSDQLAGAAVAGVSGALHERLVFDEGLPVGATLADYLVARAGDVPEVRCFVFEIEPSPGNPLGAKGAGEAGTIGAGAAVANAVADAIGEKGSSLRSLPVTSAEVFELLNPWAIGEQEG